MAINSYANVNLNSVHDVNIYDTYNNARLLDCKTPAIKGIPHVFFTTPLLNLQKENCYRDPFLSNMYYFHSDWLKALHYNGSVGTTNNNILGTSSPFIKLFYNSATNFQTKDHSSRTMEVGETYYGFKLTLPSTNVDSIIGDEISIEFYDWDKLPLLNTMYAWYLYHNKVRRGELNPQREYIKNKILDYTSSIYYFITEMDGTTIQYYAKYTGVVPISVPFSQFSSEYNDHDVIKFPVNFVYSFKEDMNPEILLDFNKTSNGNVRDLSGYYNLVDASGGHIYNDGDLPITYLQCPTNDATTAFDKTGYNHPLIIHGSYVNPANNVVNQTPDYRLVFTT